MTALPTGGSLAPSVPVLGLVGALAWIAGFVNSVALLVWAFPVGNLTALTTQAGMHSTYPALYQGRMIAAIVLAFFAGASVAGAMLAFARSFAGSGHSVILLAEAALLSAAAVIEHPIVRAAVAASACGLQNGMSSNVPGMPIRTTHFTGTLTDLGLLLGRRARKSTDVGDRGKVVVLTTTVVLFVAGAAAGVLIGNRVGDHGLVLAAGACVTVAAAISVHGRIRRSKAVG
ncbi:hypothetical protein A5658_09695 [Mycobacterium sp. 1245111.1]|uniref:DUF1275 family protein n=1 Tax=Mycobacterium sp. 1245111.1 TaxID=1834073 RepID=UPI00080037E5|nr:DUF1275 family protein [Mycobacterium sp. 1245111.1]OBK35189.1 hypothetical protein A5658_09695 [Mycobacterium sp. 1245111.1]